MVQDRLSVLVCSKIVDSCLRVYEVRGWAKMEMNSLAKGGEG
jgi:hypothetical protein